VKRPGQIIKDLYPLLHEHILPQFRQPVILHLTALLEEAFRTLGQGVGSGQRQTLFPGPGQTVHLLDALPQASLLLPHLLEIEALPRLRPPGINVLQVLLVDLEIGRLGHTLRTGLLQTGEHLFKRRPAHRRALRPGNLVPGKRVRGEAFPDLYGRVAVRQGDIRNQSPILIRSA